MMSSTGEAGKPALFLGTVDNNQLSDQEKQALLDSAVHEAKWVDQDGKKRLACAACTKTFSDRGHLRTHYNTVHLKTMYKCTVIGCEEWFSSMRARQRHIQNLHTPKQPPSQMGNSPSQPMRTVSQSMQQQQQATIQTHYQQVVHSPSGQQTIRQQPMVQQQQQVQPQHIHSQSTMVQQSQQSMMQQTAVHQQSQIIQQPTIQTSMQPAQLMQVQQPVQHQIIQQSGQQQQHIYQTQQPMQQQIISQPQQASQQQSQGVQLQQQHMIHQQQYFQQQQQQQQSGSSIRSLPQMQSIQPMTQHQPMQQHVIHQHQATVVQSLPQQASQPASQQTTQQTHSIPSQQIQVTQHGILPSVTQTVAAQITDPQQQSQQQGSSTISQPYVQNTVYQSANSLQPAQTVVMNTTQNTTISSQQSTQQVVLSSQGGQCVGQAVGSHQPITQVQVIGSTGYTVAAQPNQCNHIQQSQQQQQQQQQSVSVLQQAVEIGQMCPEHKQMHQHQSQTHVQQQQQQQHLQIHQQQQTQQHQQQHIQTHSVVVGHHCPSGHQQTAFIAGASQTGNQQVNAAQVSNNTSAGIPGSNFNQHTMQQSAAKLVQQSSNQVQRRHQTDLSSQPQPVENHQQQNQGTQHQHHQSQQNISLAVSHQSIQQAPSSQGSQQFSNQGVAQQAVQHDQTCLQHPQNQKSLPFQHPLSQHIPSPGKHGNNFVNSGSETNARQAMKRSGERDGSVPDGDAPPVKLVATDPLALSNDDSLSGITNQEQNPNCDDDELHANLMDLKNTGPSAANQVAELLFMFIKRLQDMDVNGFFAFPMTELTHPGCTTQLDRMSDLYTVKKQIHSGRYNSAPGLQLLREELDLIFTNAMKYNEEKTPEYRLAAKLWRVADDGFLSLSTELTSRFPQLFGPDAATMVLGEQSDNGSDVFHRLHADGKSASLGFLQPDNRGRLGRKHRVRTIGEEVGRPANCVGPQPPLRDDRRNKIIPVSYLDYGSFSSFAPTFDSGAAYCTKEDSDLVLGEFGLLAQSDSPEAQQRQRQRQELVDETALIVPEPELGDDFSIYLLNALTKDILKEERDSLRSDSPSVTTADDLLNNCQPSILQCVVDPSEETTELRQPLPPPASELTVPPVDVSSSTSATAAGGEKDDAQKEDSSDEQPVRSDENKTSEEQSSEEVKREPTTSISSITTTTSTTTTAAVAEKVEEESPQRLLEETASTLGKLREANYARLQQSHTRMAQVPAVEEQALADRVVASLAVMVGCNKPDDVVSNSALHRTMGVDLGAPGTGAGSEVAAPKNPVACGEA